MKYCVKKGTIIVIDGQELATNGIMLKNALSNGFAENEIEIITEEKYKERVEEENKNKVEQPTEQEKLNAQLLMENAEIKKQLTDQQELTASLLLQIAQLGGNANV